MRRSVRSALFGSSAATSTFLQTYFAGSAGSLLLASTVAGLNDGDAVATITDSVNGNVWTCDSVTKQTVSGLPVFRLVAASSSLIYRDSAVDHFYNGGHALIGGAAVFNPATAARFFSQERSISTNPDYNILANATTASTLGMQIENDTNASLLAATVALQTSVFDNTAKALLLEDDATQIIPRVNSTDSSATAYTRSGVLTLDRTAFGGLYRNGAKSNFFTMDAAVLYAFTKTPAGSDRANINTAAGALIGISV